MTDQAPVAQPGDIDLSYLDDDFAQAEVKETDFTPVPDGKYQVNVEKVELTRAQTSGNPMLKWTLRVLGPTQRERLIWKNSVMTADTMEFVKKDLLICGVTIQRLSDLSQHLEDLLDTKLEIQKKTKGENENIFFNKRIVTEGGSDGGYQRAASEAKTPF